MHSYLRAIGFSKITSRMLLEPVYRKVLAEPTRKTVTSVSADTKIIQLERDFGDGFGLSLVGEIAADGFLSIEHYFPYVTSDQLTNQERIYIEKHGDKEAFAGISDSYELGMTLIFFLRNIAQYEHTTWLNVSNLYMNKVYLSALSTQGKIILNISPQEDSGHAEESGINQANRSKLLEAARQGDKTALESLTLDDMDTYSLINKRVRHEDILSIVDTNFMPYGIETEHYSLIGNILKVEEKVNSFTGEHIYILTVQTNDIAMTIAISKEDLMGEPAVGRRFKGVVWLQGLVVL